MEIPDYQSLMLPFLQELQDSEEHSLKDIRQGIANKLGLSEEQVSQLLPSGNQGVFENRVGWARTYLKKAGLLKSERRGIFQITERGIEVLKSGIEHIDVDFLTQFQEFVEFRNSHKEEKQDIQAKNQLAETPDEVIEQAFQQLSNELSSEILEQVKNQSWQFFEKLVIDLLLKMGYGGSRREAGEAFQRGSDEGIDGIIKEDRLGLDIIYVQAKRWKEGSTVGRPEIQKFAGALQGKRARKGVFITTSSFSKDAIEYAGLIESKIILIGGDRLAELMIEHGVGVTTARAYEIKNLDQDYFVD